MGADRINEICHPGLADLPQTGCWVNTRSIIDVNTRIRGHIIAGTVRTAAAGVIWQPIEALELVELGSHDLKSSSFGWGSFRRRDGYREDQVGEGSMAGSYGALTASLSRPRPFSPSRYVACERLVTCAPAYEAPPRFARSPSPSTDYDRVGGASNTLPRAATSYIVCAAHLRATAAARLALGRGARCAASPRRRTSRSPRRRVA